MPLTLVHQLGIVRLIVVHSGKYFCERLYEIRKVINFVREAICLLTSGRLPAIMTGLFISASASIMHHASAEIFGRAN